MRLGCEPHDRLVDLEREVAGAEGSQSNQILVEVVAGCRVQDPAAGVDRAGAQCVVVALVVDMVASSNRWG
jgi:hypothetical protein